MKLYKLTAILLILVLSGACTDNFDELAVNPNSPEKVIPSMLFTQAALDVVSPDYGTELFYPALVSRQVVWTENIHSYQYYYFDRAGFGGYGSMRNVQKMMQEAERTQEPVYAGLGHFFNAWHIYNMTMTFGDIPYSGALKGETEAEYLPKYDTQEDVFVGILAELELANQLLATTEGKLTGDVVYNGNTAKWRKATNTFALKVLMSLSKRAGESKINVAEKFKQIAENPAEYPVFSSNEDNMQLVFRDKGGERYPFWHSSHSQYPHMDAFFVQLLKDQQDKRLFYYAAPTGAALSSGIKANNFDAYQGADGTAPYETLVQMEAAKALSRINPRYYEDFDNEPYVSLGYPELQFILAEATNRGWIAGAADVPYNAGIKASMEFIRKYGRSYEGVSMDDDWINAYISSAAVAYNPAQGLQQIITQKYIATFLNAGWTNYYNYRRTGLPDLPVNPATSLNAGYENKIPLRWKYPQKELDYNTQHVEEAIKRQFSEDNVNTTMWLLK